MQQAVARPTKSRNGRPSLFSEELAASICARVAEGESLTSVCDSEEMPDLTTVFRWFPKHAEFRQAYELAREARSERVFEQCLGIADEGSNDWMERNDPNNPGYIANGEHIQRSRLRVDTRKWFLSRMFPQKYGDQPAQPASVTVNVAALGLDSKLRTLAERVDIPALDAPMPDKG